MMIKSPSKKERACLDSSSNPPDEKHRKTEAKLKKERPGNSPS